MGSNIIGPKFGVFDVLILNHASILFRRGQIPHYSSLVARPKVLCTMAQYIPDPSNPGSSLERVVVGRHSVLYKQPKKDNGSSEFNHFHIMSIRPSMSSPPTPTATATRNNLLISMMAANLKSNLKSCIQLVHVHNTQFHIRCITLIWNVQFQQFKHFSVTCNEPFHMVHIFCSNLAIFPDHLMD